MIPQEKLDFNTLTKLMGESRSPTEWFEEFSVLSGVGFEYAGKDEELGRLREGVKSLKMAFTPGPRSRRYEERKEESDWRRWEKVEIPKPTEGNAEKVRSEGGTEV